MSSPVVGRDAELAQLDRFVAALSGGAAALVLSGAPGIGKTALWRAGAAGAESSGARVLRSACVEVEMPIEFGALADLLEEPFGEIGDGLPPPQRRAVAVAFGRVDETGERGDWLALAIAVRTILRTLADRRPVVLAIDDLQWLDGGTRRVLAWALRRLGNTSVALLTTLRTGSDPDPLALSEVLPGDRFTTIAVPPMSGTLLRRLIGERVGVHLPRPAMDRVCEASGGNPLYAIEIARGLRDSGIASGAVPLSVPSSLDQLMRSRVTAVPERVRPLLELIAANGRTTVALLRRAFGDDQAERLLAEAARSELVDAPESGPVRLAHPLLASAVYHAVSAPRRRDLHRRLADLASSQEEHGRHAALAASGPDAGIAGLVADAASAAAARGALDTAAALAAEAARLTPPGDPASFHRALDAARWLVDTGQFHAAATRLDTLMAADLQPSARAEVLLVRAECEMADRRKLVTLLAEARDIAPEPRQRWHALIRLAQHGGWVSGDTGLAVDLAGESLDVAHDLGDPRLVETSHAALDFYRAARADPEPAPAENGHAGPPPRTQWWLISPRLARGCRLMWSGELDSARAVMEDECTSHDRAGRDAHAGFVRCWLSEAEWRAGHWARAQALADEATERLGDIAPTAFPRALLAAVSGRADEAYAIAGRVLAWTTVNEERVAPPRMHWLLGMLELSRQDPARAFAALTEALGMLDSCGIREPGYLPVLPDLAESLVALGRLDEADEVISRLAAVASGHRWAAFALQRSRALALLSRRDSAAAATLALAAAAGFDTVGAPLDRGRALLVAGNAQRRLGERRQAAQTLAAAASVFTDLGAVYWLRQATEEMRRASPRPRAGGRLTAAEARVAAQVAAGRTNKQVAAELFTTAATVEAHLTRIYRKLDLRSRTELAGRVADGTIRFDGEER